KDDAALKEEVQSLLVEDERARGFMSAPLLPSSPAVRDVFRRVVLDFPPIPQRNVPLLAPSSRLGPYEILEVLGTGGMGEVYRARDTKLNRDVAIKVLLPAVANDPDRLARFSREAQVLASLNHPNIAHIYGLHRQEGQD